MARGSNSRDGRAARSEGYNSLRGGTAWLNREKIRSDNGLFPITNLVKDEDTLNQLKIATENRIRAELPNDLKDNLQARDMAYEIARSMTEQGKRVENDAWMGMNQQFMLEVSKAGHNFGFDSGLGGIEPDPATTKAIANLVAEVARDKNNEFGGEWFIRSHQGKDGYALEAYTSVYTGRDGDGEKTYSESRVIPIMKVPYDEISKRINVDKIAFDREELFRSGAFQKANGMRAYLEAVLQNAQI